MSRCKVVILGLIYVPFIENVYWYKSDKHQGHEGKPVPADVR